MAFAIIRSALVELDSTASSSLGSFQVSFSCNLTPPHSDAQRERAKRIRPRFYLSNYPPMGTRGQ